MFTKPIFDKPNVLVTGGAGFIGSHLCEALLGAKNKVICLDNFTSGSQRNIEHLLSNADFIFLKHDITAPIDLAAAPELERFKVKFQGVQEIYHLACPTSPKDFEAQRIPTLLANAYGTVNALHVAAQYEAKFLLASSSVVYGPRQPGVKFQREDQYGGLDHLSPRGCYDEGKRFAETAVATYRQQYGIPAKIARIFRTYGPRQRLRIGEMIPDFIVQALEGKNLVIYGDETFATSLTYVDDIVSGLMKLMASDEGGPMNFGNPEEVRLVDVAKQVITMTGSAAPVTFEPPLLFMTPLGLPDITLARELLGWIPIVRLEDGLKKSIEYAQAHKEMLGY
ncbi:GDP-mannose 4,6-dehydratase [Candidatus Uhrbacteria bacterium]|nr:GDP-mannose 4,6-dehydratase [Candidatus Uhrbacteria bacterium]